MSNLPAVAQLSFPGSDLTSQQTTGQRVYSIYDWDFDAGEFRLQDGRLVLLTGLDYLKVWIRKALQTMKNTLLYVGTNYGNECYTLIGQDFDPSYTQSEYERMVNDCLLQNDAITSVDGFSFAQTGSTLTISFTVHSIYGTTNQSLEVAA